METSKLAFLERASQLYDEVSSLKQESFYQFELEFEQKMRYFKTQTLQQLVEPTTRDRRKKKLLDNERMG